jgi:hypothetical protein
MKNPIESSVGFFILPIAPIYWAAWAKPELNRPLRTMKRSLSAVFDKGGMGVNILNMK